MLDLSAAYPAVHSGDWSVRYWLHQKLETDSGFVSWYPRSGSVWRTRQLGYSQAGSRKCVQLLMYILMYLYEP